MTPLRPYLLLTLALLGLAAACKREVDCARDELVCGGRCAAVATDPDNCGACGVACADGETCSAGLCRCADGRAACGGGCFDLASDPDHCGACGTSCADGLVCTTSAAGATACAATCAQGTQTSCDGACVDLATDPFHCGACGRACGSGERCDAGHCLADLYLACFNTGELRGATRALAPAGTPLRVPPGPTAITWLDGAVYVASAAFGGSETVWAARFDAAGSRADAVFAANVQQPDLEAIAEHDGLLYVSQSLVGTILVLTPNGTLVDEIPVAATASNPLGITFVGDHAYVALNETGEVLVLDVSGEATCATGGRPTCAREVARIDLAPLASSGALPRPAAMVATHGRVYAALWNLTPAWGVPPGGSGRLAVIEPATGDRSPRLDPGVQSGGVAGLLDLGPGCLNPAGLAVRGDVLYVSCGRFDYGSTPPAIQGAGVAQVALSGAGPGVGSLLAAPAGAAPGKLAFCGDAGYVADRNSGKVFRLDTASGLHGGVELCPPKEGSTTAYVADLACAP